MAKKRDRKGGSQKSTGDAPADGPGLRRHLRRLEKLLAEAAKKESRRVRKLEKAHIQRQRIETELQEARPATSAVPGRPAGARQAAPAEPSGDQSRRTVRARPVPSKSVPAKSAAKPVPAKPVPAKSAAKPVPAKSAAKPVPTTTTPDPTAPGEPAI